MSAFYLVIYIYAGALANGDSVSLVSIPQTSIESCQKSGEQAKVLVTGSSKNLRFVCIKANQ